MVTKNHVSDYLRLIGCRGVPVDQHDACVPSKIQFRDDPARLKSVAISPPLLLRIGALNPEGAVEHTTMKVDGGNSRALLAAVDRQLVNIFLGDSPVIFTEEVTYIRNGEERRALHCFDQKTGDYPNIDCQDGRLVDHASVISTSLRFLRPSSPLPFSSSLPPVVAINTDAEFLISTPKRQLQAASLSSLMDPNFLALLWGVRSGTQIYWKLAGAFCFVNAESGRIFEIDKIPGGPKQFVFALLQDKSSVPHARVPEGRYLIVYRRETSPALRIEKGSLRCRGPLQFTDMDLWTTPAKVDAFDEDFAAAACK